jgi:hypothetical protein
MVFYDRVYDAGMGFLRYGAEAFPMEDRALIHLQIAVHEMFQQRASFYLTWIRPLTEGSGRVSILLTPGVHLMFEYSGNRLPRINPGWVDHLVSNARSGTGLLMLPEPAPTAPETTKDPA